MGPQGTVQNGKGRVMEIRAVGDFVALLRQEEHVGQEAEGNLYEGGDLLTLNLKLSCRKQRY